jgi:hypothetical protein
MYENMFLAHTQVCEGRRHPIHQNIFLYASAKIVLTFKKVS